MEYLDISNAIPPLSDEFDLRIKQKIDGKTKPIGSLGQLEELAFKLAKIQQTESPRLKKPVVAVFAADHGIAASGLVNPFPQEVTYQMVMNFLSGGAAINVLAKEHNIKVKVIDAGVNHTFEASQGLTNAKIGFGTRDYRYERAMDIDQCRSSLQKGADIVQALFDEGTNIIGFGEMGIGNTSSAALLMSAICRIPVAECVGRGTGVDNEQLRVKIEVLESVVRQHVTHLKDDPIEIMATYGGFEIAQMCGGMLQAATNRMAILVDGFISTAAMLMASTIDPMVLRYAFFSHRSGEKGHAAMLDWLKAEPILDLGMRLGEGTGCALAYPVLKAACTFINDMASFDEAKVSKR